MKRIFTLMIAAFFAAGMSAQTTAGGDVPDDVASGEDGKIELWSGAQVFDSWEATIVIDATKFATAEAGDLVRANFKDKGADFNPIFKIVSSYADLEGMQSQIVRADTYFEAPVNAEVLAELKAHGLRFQGLGFTLTSVELVKTTPLLKIPPLTYPKMRDTARYNLSGQKVDGNYKGVVIQDGKKFVVK